MHTFELTTTWTGNTGAGTTDYKSYSRNHEISGRGKASPVQGSSDPRFRGDGSRYNPEELLVGSLSACHMLWMLHLCADSGIVINTYVDHAIGEMAMNADGSGQFTCVTLRPEITIADASRIPQVEALHHCAHDLCFIARSMNFPVRTEPRTVAS
jgi:organic hydroperoxide reductase OsmC/OhrA